MNTTTTPDGSPARPPNRTPARTPRRLITAEPPSTHRSIHTPLDRSESHDLRSSFRASFRASGRRGNAPTPHAKAARWALDQRRTAMFTPGKNRRRSLMEQRETPMGLLRNLGRKLAPTSKPILSSSSSTSSPMGRSRIAAVNEEDEGGLDDLDEDFPIDRPRLSLPIDQDDDDDELPPPRVSGIGFDDENYTVQSIELPRRAVVDRPESRMSRGSIESMRLSDYFEANDPTDDVGQQSDFFPGLLEDLQARAGADDSTIERLDEDATRRTLGGRESDFNFNIPLDVGEQTTFVMSDPAVDAPGTSRIEERSVVEATAEDAQEQGAGDVYSDDDQPPGFDYGGFDDHSDLENNLDQQLEDETPLQKHRFAAQDDTITRAFSPQEYSQERRRVKKSQKKRKKISRHGIEYPALPTSFVKSVALKALQSSGLSNSRLSADTLDVLAQASEWFFEQLSDDLGAYASHGKRKTIEESDVIMLMRRQRQVGGNATMFSLAQRHLPRELLQELRMPVPQPVKQRRNKRVEDDGEEDVTEVT